MQGVLLSDLSNQCLNRLYNTNRSSFYEGMSNLLVALFFLFPFLTKTIVDKLTLLLTFVQPASWSSRTGEMSKG